MTIVREKQSRHSTAAVPFSGGLLHVESYTQGEAHQHVVFCHGGGTRPLTNFRVVANELSARGFNCHIFDFPGHGQSSGVLGDQSLRIRYEALSCLLAHLNEDDYSLVGFSMGADNVVRCANSSDFPVSRAIIGAPAAYSQRAFGLRFKPDFTEEITRAESWESSELFDLWEGFVGEKHLLVPEHDSVIPQAITDRYVSFTERSHVHRLAGFSHTLTQNAASSPDKLAALVAVLERCLTQTNVKLG